MSSGQHKKSIKFNPTQIKDGWIVRLTKDGRLKSKIEPYTPNHPKKAVNG